MSDEDAAQEEAGSVLGEMTEGEDGAALSDDDGLSGFFRNHPWRAALIALIVLALLYSGYGAYQKKRNGTVR